MPDRAVIALLPTFALAFICGVIGAAYEMHSTAAFWLWFVGAMFALVAGVISTFRAPGAASERRTVGALRAVLDVAIFTLVYLGLLAFLRDAQLGLAILLLLVAAACGIVLAQLRVREPDEVDGTHAQPH